MPVTSSMTLHINGEQKTVAARSADTLLDVLRERLGLTGTKNGCANGDCDTCTVLVDGRPIKSCLMLAVEAVGHHITTIEGLHDTPVQQAFIKENALQCGFCTPGFILNSYALMQTHPNADDTVIDDWLSSNVCRCTGYEEIKKAVHSALAQQNSESMNLGLS